MKDIQNQQLKSYNTFMVSALCDRLVQVENDDEIPRLWQEGIFNQPYLVLGGGSNILFTDDFHGTIVQMCTHGIAVIEEDTDSALVEVAAGVDWTDFVDFCIQNHYYGVENLIGIPGRVGSSPVQNIGAYGVEVKDVIDSVIGFRISSQKPFALRNEECAFGYRSSIFKTEWKNDVLITRVRFRLSKILHFTLTYQALSKELENRKLELTLENVAALVKSIRDAKLPDITKIGCAGSFFKNPVVDIAVRDRLAEQLPQLVSYPAGEGKVKLAAGQLIDLAGMKGVREGDAGVYPLQALVIVNYGNASGSEICTFYKKVQKAVFDRFGIAIEPEVNIE
jgi:UDP-N-acetylmuramate dehydrogenase